MQDIIVKFLTYLVHFYVPIGQNRNFLVDTSSSNGVNLYFEKDHIVFHRFIPDPPDVCNDIPGQPETLFIIRAHCCGGMPYIFTKYQIKQNGFWLTKSIDLNILVPGAFSYSNRGTVTGARSKVCSFPSSFEPSIFSILNWEDLLSTLDDYYRNNGGNVYGDFNDFINFIQYPATPSPDVIGCTHPLQESCSTPGWYITLTDDFEVIIPWVPVVFPSQISDPLQAITTYLPFMMAILGIDPNSISAGLIYFITEPVVTGLVAISPLTRDNDDPCFEDYYLRKVYLGVRFCPCPQGFTYVDGECKPLCPPCTVWNGVNCVSVSKCFEGDPLPDPDEYFDGDEIKPLPDPTPPPGGDYIWDDNIDNFIPRPDPPPGTTCPVGTYWDGTNCVSDKFPKCPDGKHWDGSKCVTSPTRCPDGTRWDGTNCVPEVTPDCPPDCYFNGEECVCSTDDPHGPYLPPPDDPDPPPSIDYPSPRVPPPPGPDPLPPPTPPPGKIDWDGSHLCASYTWYIRGDVDQIPQSSFKTPGIYTYLYPAGTSGRGTQIAYPRIPGYPPPYLRYEVGAGSGEWYKVGTESPSGPNWVLPEPTGQNAIQIWVANQTNGIVASAVGDPNSPQSPYWMRCGPRRGVYQIFAWFNVNVSGIGCIPNPLISWFINKFLATFSVTEGFQNTWIYRYEVFGPANETDPKPYVDMTGSPTGKPSFRWQALWREIDLTSVYLPCLQYEVSLMKSYVRFQAYE